MHMTSKGLTLRLGGFELERGDELSISFRPAVLDTPQETADDGVYLRFENMPPILPVGALLVNEAETPLLQVLANLWEPKTTVSSRPNLAENCVWVRALADYDALETPLRVHKEGLSLAWVTLSDKGAAGEREDASGPRMEELARRGLPIAHAQGFLLPDDPMRLKALLLDLAVRQRFDLILTSGGTGLGPRDTTPEAVGAVLDKRLPGFERAMLMTSLQKTPHAMISRAVAGTIAESLVITLPGSLKAVTENLEAVLPAVKHAIEKLQGDPADCGA
jgi:molybdopterin adenylyltransferase